MNSMMTRKEFLRLAGIGVSAFVCTGGVPFVFPGSAGAGGKSIKGSIFKGDAPEEPGRWSTEGHHYATDGKTVQCQVCPNRCVLEPGDRSICRSKVNIRGKLYSLAYGNPCSANLDPIEKKPLFHFHPRTSILSIATTGCNFRCLNCQNWEISQKKPEEVHHGELFPDEVAAKAKEAGSPSIAYTYSEPITFYEYVYDTAVKAKEQGLKNVLVSNGYINQGPLVKLCGVVDAANVNLKSFEDEIYRCLNGGTLRPVLETFKTLHTQGVWFEMTTLVVPTYVDNPDMIRRMCRWILKELGPDYPLHFLRFFPQYKLTRLPKTPVATLEKLRTLAMEEGIRYVYIGNVPGHEGNHTYCHECGTLLIERNGYRVTLRGLKGGRCAKCDAAIPGRWS